jgi:hypothetical protein
MSRLTPDSVFSPVRVKRLPLHKDGGHAPTLNSRHRNWLRRAAHRMSEAELREPIKRNLEKLGLSSGNVVPLEKKEDDKPDAHTCYDHIAGRRLTERVRHTGP